MRGPQEFPEVMLGRRVQVVFAPGCEPFHPTYDVNRFSGQLSCRLAKALELTAHGDFVLLQLYGDHGAGDGGELYQAWVATKSIAAFVPVA